MQQHNQMAAAAASDAVAYAQSVANQLVTAIPAVSNCKVISHPQPAPHQIIISDTPYTALTIEMSDANATGVLVQIWGDSVIRAWQQHELELNQEVILQQQAADIVLRNLPMRSDLSTMLQTAAEAIGQLLGATAVNIYLKPDPSSSTQEFE